MLLILRRFATALSVLAGFLVSAQIPRFQHVVIIFQENRTPDNLFQGLCVPNRYGRSNCSITPKGNQYNIQTAAWKDRSSSTGYTNPASVPLANHYDLSHAHTAFTAMCNLDAASNTCAMNGAGSIACSGTCLPKPQFRYVDNSTGTLNPYLTMAREYGWANYMFQTNQGPSFPAHQFIFGGTSAPSAADDAAGIYASENMSGASNTAGCAAPAGTTVAVISPGVGENQKIPPCFEHQTIPDLLSSGLTWRYYAPTPGSIWTAPNAIQHICQSTGDGGKCAGPQWTNNVDLTPAHVLTDIASCNLPAITWVIPTGANSDHANANDGGGPSWVASIVNAIGNSAGCDSNSGYWKNTAIVLTWDDWGGWYDHEPPTILPLPQGDYQYGFRVPLIMISAYTPHGYVDNQRHEFGSILRFVEQNFGISQGALNFADARGSDNLTEFFDLKAAPRTFHTITAKKTAAFFIHDKRPPTDPDDE